MGADFLSDNVRLLAALDAPELRRRRDGLVARLRQELIEEGGGLLELHPVQFFVDPADLVDLTASVRGLTALQTRLMNAMIADVGREGVMARFDVPAAMRRFVDWDELADPRGLIGRFDLLRDRERFWCCEINMDSCVAGAEIFDVGRDYFAALGLPSAAVPPRPLDDLAQLVVNRAAAQHAERIIILDWSKGGGSGGKGYLTFDRMRSALSRVCDLPVHIADEQSYDPAWLTPEAAPRTFVHRGFMMHEMDDEGAFLDRLIAAGTRVHATYESEIRMDKTWFSIFHQALGEGRLTAAEADLVRRFVPQTEDVTAASVARLIAARDELIFKAKRSYGGADILIGAETSADALRAAFSGDGANRFVAQRMLPLETLIFPHAPGKIAERHHMVFGLYQYGRRTNGLLVRASVVSRIVNVTIGHARLAWALALGTADRDAFVAGLTGAAA